MQIMQIMEKKRLQGIFNMVHGVSVMQLDVYSHMVVELSAVESSMYYFSTLY